VRIEERQRPEFPEIKEVLNQIEAPHSKTASLRRELEKILKKSKGARKEAIAYYSTETCEASQNHTKHS